MATHWPFFVGYSFLLTLALATMIGSYRIIRLFFILFLRLTGNLDRALGTRSLSFEPLTLQPLTLEPLTLEMWCTQNCNCLTLSLSGGRTRRYAAAETYNL